MKQNAAVSIGGVALIEKVDGEFSFFDRILKGVNGNVARGYNGFGLENLDRVILRTNLPIVSPNIVSVTNYEDTKVTASNTNEGTCLSRNGECGIGSVNIIRR